MAESMILNSTPLVLVFVSCVSFSSRRSDGPENHSKLHPLVCCFSVSFFENRSRRRSGVRESFSNSTPLVSFFLFRVFHSSRRRSDGRENHSKLHPPRFLFLFLVLPSSSRRSGGRENYSKFHPLSFPVLFLVFHSSSRGKRVVVRGRRQGDGVEVRGLVQGDCLIPRAWG